MKIQTINLQGKQYAQVKDRLKEFLEANPKGKHESAYQPHADGSIVFTVWLWKDKTDLLDLIKSGITDKEALRSSADANGNAKGEAGKKAKDFEKLETIALGRALANVGYLSSGEIASSEEMEEYEAYKSQKSEESIRDMRERLESVKTLDELKKIWSDMPIDAKTALASKKDELKSRLEEPSKKAVGDKEESVVNENRFYRTKPKTKTV